MEHLHVGLENECDPRKPDHDAGQAPAGHALAGDDPVRRQHHEERVRCEQDGAEAGRDELLTPVDGALRQPDAAQAER